MTFCVTPVCMTHICTHTDLSHLGEVLGYMREALQGMSTPSPPR